jgi:hypothetical protein
MRLTMLPLAVRRCVQHLPIKLSEGLLGRVLASIGCLGILTQRLQRNAGVVRSLVVTGSLDVLYGPNQVLHGGLGRRIRASGH